MSEEKIEPFFGEHMREAVDAFMPLLKPNGPAKPPEPIPWDNDDYRHTQERSEPLRDYSKCVMVRMILDQSVDFGDAWDRNRRSKELLDGYGSYE